MLASLSQGRLRARPVAPSPAAAAPARQPALSRRRRTCRAGDSSFTLLADWVQKEGGSLAGLTMDDCRMGPVTVRGLVARQPISQSSIIMSVPFDSTIKDIDTPEAFPGAPWNVSVALRMLQEVRQGPPSHWYPYLQSLPQEASGPILLDASSLHEIQYPPAIQAVQEYQQQAADAYDQLQLRYAPHVPPWEDWLWALQMVQSRTIRFAVSSCRVMVPGVDLLNHGGNAANGQLLLSSAASNGSGRAICFQASRDIAAGEQVLWSYGDRSNDDFFVYHGFCLHGNAADGVVLFEDLQQLVDWYCEEQQQQQHQPQTAGSSSSRRELVQMAEAAADLAAATAAVQCSSPHIQGTTSSLYTPLLPLELPGASTAAAGEAAAGSSSSSPPRLRRGIPQHGPAAPCGLDAAAAGRWAAGAVQQHIAEAGVERQLASLRLHQRYWGMPGCPTTAPELLLRADGSVDVRCLAALAALLSCAPPIPGGSSAPAGSWSSNHSSSSSSSISSNSNSSRSWQEGVACLLGRRSHALLQQYPSSLGEDEGVLKEQRGEGLLGACLQYRVGKKSLLAAASQAAAGQRLPQAVGRWG